MLRIAGFVLAAMAGVVSVAATAIAADPIGKVVAVGGSPTGSGRPLSAGSPVYENDRLVTGKGNIQIIFIDDTRMVVGPNSSLVVDRFLLKGGKSAQKFSVNALRGTFRFITGDMAKKAYDIQTASATIGIRGTAFDFSSGNETLIAVLQGGVSLCAAGECAAIPDKCGVGRAGGKGAGKLSGRSKSQALRQLPFILNQSALGRSFRLNTQSCRSSLSLLPKAFPDNNQGPAGAGPQGAGPAGAAPGGGGGGGPPGGGPPGGGSPGGGPGGGGGSGGGPGRGQGG